MLALPPITVSRRRIRLPWPADDAVLLANVLLADTRSVRAELLSRLLQQCPSLLIWASYHCQRAWRATSASDRRHFDTLDWLQGNLAGLVQQQWPRGCVSYAPLRRGGKRISLAVARLLEQVAVSPAARARPKDFDVGQFQRRLAEFARQASGLPGRDWLGWIGRSRALSNLTANLFPWCLERRSKVIARLAERWSGARASPLTIDLAGLAQRCGATGSVAHQENGRLTAEKLAALKQLAYGASHEVNNPLANIATRAQTLLFDEQDVERRRKLASIHHQAMRAHEMIAGLMLFAHPPRPRPVACNLQEIIEAVINELFGTAEQQETVLVAIGLAGQPVVQADAGQIAVAIKALVENSLEAVRYRGRVEIELIENKGSSGVSVVVRDSGPGLSEENLRHMFDPFYSGREAGRGLGFGLSKAWRIAELHGGSLTGGNHPAGGAVFELRLPRKATTMSC